MGTLYIVGTPIGNLGDISMRAVETLKKVSLVASEDTRRTLGLLSHLGISVKMLSCRAQNEDAAASRVIAALKEGQDVAYTSDAGTPALSDPGAALSRKAAEAGFPVIPIPGPSAFATLVSVAGLPDKSVLFEGFLSPKPGRRRSRVKELLDSGLAFVLYESPFRVLKLLGDIAEFDSERYVCVGREMTKIHEEYLRGPVSSVLLTIRDEFGDTDKIRGEFSVCVSGIDGR